MKKFWDIILGITLILYIVVINVISSVRIAFSLPIVTIGIILIIYHFIKGKIKESDILAKIYKLIKIFLCIGLISFIGIEVAIISYPKYNEKKS